MSLLYPQALILFLWVFWRYNKNQKWLYLALSLLILALTRPVLLEQKQSQKLQGKSLIIALDVSYSMRATDIQPSRLDAAKTMIKTILNTSHHDSFSLFAFTTNPLILCPATTDHTLLSTALNSLKVENILTHGTDLKTLFERIAKIHTPQKNILLFTDGGDDIDLEALRPIVQENKLHIYAIATATPNGSPLFNAERKKLKDKKGNLIITRLNPKLKTLAQQSGGEFFTLKTFDASLDFINNQAQAQKERLGYLELFWIPTLLALLIFLMHFLKIPAKILVFLPFLALDSQAGILDWYYLQNAKNAYEHSAYAQAIQAYQHVTSKTIQSELNLANSYYQAGHYTEAKAIYNSLKTTNPRLKKHILFKLANCAVKQQEYNKARHFYLDALRFGKDENIVANLHLIHTKKTKQRRDFPAFHSPDKDKKDTPQGSSKKQKKNTKGKSGKSMQEGAGTHAKGKANQKNSAKSTQHTGTLTHPLGYKAYELINKGYLDEKTPW